MAKEKPPSSRMAKTQALDDLIMGVSLGSIFTLTMKLPCPYIHVLFTKQLTALSRPTAAVLYLRGALNAFITPMNCTSFDTLSTSFNEEPLS